jgi:hypothetical protein
MLLFVFISIASSVRCELLIEKLVLRKRKLFWATPVASSEVVVLLSTEKSVNVDSMKQ